MRRFVDKVALVTGGRSGIGRAIAARLSAEGARVLTAQRGEDDRFESIPADFTDSTTAARVIKEIEVQAGGLDILINNAGMMEEGAVETLSLADWNRSLMVNLTTPFLLIQAALPLLRKRGGSIVNIGSIEGIASNPNHAAYCAAKAGLHALTRAVAVDLGDRDEGGEGGGRRATPTPHQRENVQGEGKSGVQGILGGEGGADFDGEGGSEGERGGQRVQRVRCNAVAPGWIDTELNRDFISGMPNPDAFRQDIGKIHPVGRTGTPEEVASLTAFLASDEASFITGQTYVIDGGRTIHLPLP